MEKIKLNLGCGTDPIKGYVNIDNSPSLLLAHFPTLCSLLRKIGVISDWRWEIIQKFRERRALIRHGSLKNKLPFPSGIASVIYASHLLEHLSYEQTVRVIEECFRVLSSKGVFRIVVPDLQMRIQNYMLSLNQGDPYPANHFIESLAMGEQKTPSLFHKIASLIHDQRHRWMYDGMTLKNLLEEKGFVDVQILGFRRSRIEEVTFLDSDTRKDESVYVEGIKL